VLFYRDYSFLALRLECQSQNTKFGRLKILDTGGIIIFQKVLLVVINNGDLRLFYLLVIIVS
jgi:hypothetical protein